jgi:opacity protein-like surface antigen
MKKIEFIKVFMLIALSSCANNLFSQGAYVNINAGYGHNLSSQNLSYFDLFNQTRVSGLSTYEQLNVSLGKGINAGAAIGYMFNKNLGAELGLSYLMGGKTKATHTYTGGVTNFTLSAKMFRINPTLVIASGLEQINPYLKFGLLIGSGSVLYEYNDNDAGDVELIDRKLSGGLAFGFTAGAGVSYSLNEKMLLFGEIAMVNMSSSPKDGEIIKATFNGADELAGMTTREKKTLFVDSYTYNSVNPPAESLPREELKQKIPFGSIGINFGFRFGF